jgi:hypothetical protein
MNWLWREKPDGRRAPGYGLFLLAGAAMGVAIYLLHRRFVPDAAIPGRRRPPSSHVAAITQPAATMSRIEVRNRPPAAEGRSYRLASPQAAAPASAAAPGPDPFDAIAAALAQLPSDPGLGRDRASLRPLDENVAGRQRVASSGYPELPPAFAAEAAAGGKPLVAYRDPQAEAGPGGPAGRAGGAIDPSLAIVPRGTLVEVYLLTTVDTSNPAAVLQLGAARPLVFHRRRLLPFGTRFLGRLVGGPMRDRLNLGIDTILYPDGRELPIRAAAVEADEDGGSLRPGIAARYYPPPAWVELAPYVSDVITGYLGLLESRASSPVAVGLGGLSLQTAASEPRTALYQASAQAIQDFAQARLKELGQRYASFYLVPAGTACWLQLESDLDLGAGPGAERAR